MTVHRRIYAPNVKSGLDEAVKILKDIPEIGFNKFSTRDVVRHPLVQRIVKAYEDYERRAAKRDEKREEKK